MFRGRISAAAIAACALAAQLIALGPAAAVGRAAATPAPCPQGELAGSSAEVRFTATERPVIFVHGWNGSIDNLLPTATALRAALGSRNIRTLMFDYSGLSNFWPSTSGIASCLADYIHAASDGYRAAGGDGKVLVVAHSMGGLATMFATSPQYAADPVTADQLGGVVTFDTPFLGSPFGNQDLARGMEGATQLLSAQYPLALLATPAGKSDASICLAPHAEINYNAPSSATGGAPSGCALAPYLPAAVPLTELSGDITVTRRVLGQTLYSFDLGSDGIVPIGSSGGYLGGSPPPRPAGEAVDAVSVPCTVDTNSVDSIASKINVHLPLAGRLIRTAVSLFGDVFFALADGLSDKAALDEIGSGNTGKGFYLTVASIYLAAPCSHSGILTYPPAIQQAAHSLRVDMNNLAASGPKSNATEIVVDVSSSMDEAAGNQTKLEAAQQASSDVLQVIEAEQSLTPAQVGVITFSDDSTVLEPLSPDVGSAQNAVAGLQTESDTNMGAGIQSGLDSLVSGSGSKTIILLSDGVTNTGLSRDEILSELVPKAVAEHVKIDTVALGDEDVDYDLLQQIAAGTGGTYSTALDVDQLRKDFISNQQSTRGVVIGTNSGSIANNQLVTVPSVQVPYDQKTLEVSLAWDNGQLALHLTDPKGHTTIVQPATSYALGQGTSGSTDTTGTSRGTSPGTIDTTGGTGSPPALSSQSSGPAPVRTGDITVLASDPAVVIVRNPRPGLWHLAVRGLNIPDGGTAYFTVASRQGGGHTPRPAAWHKAVVPVSVAFAVLCLIGVVDAVLVRRRYLLGRLA